MKHLINLTATIIISFCCSSTVFAQADSSVIKNIKSYVLYIDSVNKLDYAQDQGFISGITDGIIKVDGETVGGYGIYTLANTKADTVYRIEYHENYPINTYKTYYFKHNQLVYARLELQGGKSYMERIYLREEYYRNEKMIGSATSKDKRAGKYPGKTNIILYPDALNFLTEYVKENGR